MLTDQTIIYACPDLAVSPLGDGIAILNMKTGIYFSLNAAGARIWEQLRTQPQPISALFEAILSEYDVDYETCRRDVFALVERMQNAHLIESSEDSLP